MAKAKDKIITKAQTYLKKGQTDKAIKEYLNALEKDKKDVRLHMRLGDLYGKKKDSEQSIKHYLQAAQLLTKDGFYSRAAAVYRQILQIDDSRTDILESMADLYSKLGLNNEAMAQYQKIAQSYEREGRLAEAVEVMQRMLDMDPRNVVIATKLAELHYKSGNKEKGYQAFKIALDQLREEGRYEQYVKLLEKLAKADPDNMENLSELAGIYIEHDQWDRAYAVLARMHKNLPEEPEPLSKLADAAVKAGRPDEAVQYLKELAGLYRDKGLRRKAREALRRVLDVSPEDPEALAVVGSTEEPMLREEEPEEIQEVIEGSIEILEEAEPEEEVVIEAGEAIEEEEAVSLTPEQVIEHLTEAGVYMKYGLRDKAMDHIKTVLRAEPDNIKARLRLKDIHLEAGETEQALKELEWAAQKALEIGDQKSGREAVEEWLKLEPENAKARELKERLGEAPEAAEVVEEAEPVEELEEEVTIAEEAEEEAPAVVEEEVVQEEPEEEIVLDEPEEEVAVEEEEVAVEEEEVAVEEEEVAVEEEEVAVEEEEVAVEEEEPEEAAIEEPSAPAPPEPAAADLSEELEEADFYVQQGLYDEARKIYLSILSQDPTNEVAREKLAGIEAGEPEEEVIEDAQPSLQEQVIVPEPPVEAAPEPEPPRAAPEPQPPPAEQKPPAPEPPAVEPSPQPLEEQTTEFVIEQEPEPPAEPGPVQPAAPPAQPPPPPEEHFDLKSEVAEQEGRDKDWFVGPAPPPGEDLFSGEGAGEGDGLFDLAAELEKDEEFAGGDALGFGAAEEFSFEETFQAFKKGVANTISEHDSATHYDLGIAYREMGLLNDAAQEFLTASRDPVRYGDCMVMAAMTLREAGDLDHAFQTALSALDSDRLKGREKASVFFELARVMDARGERSKARWALDQGFAINPDLPELEKMLAEYADVQPEPLELEPQKGPEQEPPIDAGPPPSREKTTWEEAALEGQKEEQQAQEDSGEEKKKKRRKKISYV